MESEGPQESESSEKSVFFSQKEEEDEEDEEEAKEPEETGTLNPLLQPALTGDVEGLQKILEDPENPHHEQAMQLLLEEDIVGRNLLYAACMAGQSDVIRALAKYGVNLNEKTARGILSFFSRQYYLWYFPMCGDRCTVFQSTFDEVLQDNPILHSDFMLTTKSSHLADEIPNTLQKAEHIFWSLSYYCAFCCPILSDARLDLKKYIAKVSAAVTDSEKGPGKLFKEDKNTILNACRTKNEWLETHLEASINEIFEQKQQLEDTVTPIFTKMATPQVLDLDGTSEMTSSFYNEESEDERLSS
ncbi:PREDICTED: ankyrin repeat domain-containing protein 45 [Ceratotherium simum simum]|uniref:Ankyrin repeat domain-containing protein 45 n=1 Tax=Ceratotherium simum simum TaxID=73337 RepID=A0ABM1CGR2_CERSS|nr:PREDICTED: ankyrin repeat domain-containing protein 45 [Ceratotherium simum simum]